MQADETSKPPAKRPRLGVVVRVLIYGPLLGFFGWQAAQRHLDERRIADDNFRTSVDRSLQFPPRTIMMPNGELMPVYEVTEEEAVQMGLLPEPKSPDPAPAPPQPAP